LIASTFEQANLKLVERLKLRVEEVLRFRFVSVCCESGIAMFVCWVLLKLPVLQGFRLSEVDPLWNYYVVAIGC
jgi:hypothetical protein